MILRLFDTPIIDVLLIVLAIRFIWPELFGIRRNKKTSSDSSSQQKKTIINKNGGSKQSQAKDHEGEYIDYEEIK